MVFDFSEMISILEKDRSDEEALSYALDTLANVCSPEEFEEEVAEATAVPRRRNSEKAYGCVGEQFTEIFLKKDSNVQLVLDTLEEYDFKVRRPGIKLLTNLLINKPRDMQEIILKSHMGVSRLVRSTYCSHFELFMICFALQINGCSSRQQRGAAQ